MLRDGSLASRRLRPSLRAPPGSRAGNPGNVCVCVFFTFGPYFEIACPFVSHCCFCVLFVYFKKTPQVVSLSPLEGNFLLIVPHSATDSCHMCSVSQASLCRQMTIQGLTHTHAYIYICIFKRSVFESRVFVELEKQLARFCIVCPNALFDIIMEVSNHLFGLRTRVTLSGPCSSSMIGTRSVSSV